MHAFIIRPFGIKNGIDFDHVEQELIRPALAVLNISGGGTGEFIEQGNIRTDIWAEISGADLIMLSSLKPRRVGRAYKYALAGAPDFAGESVRQQLLYYRSLGILTENTRAALDNIPAVTFFSMRFVQNWKFPPEMYLSSSKNNYIKTSVAAGDVKWKNKNKWWAWADFGLLNLLSVSSEETEHQAIYRKESRNAYEQFIKNGPGIQHFNSTIEVLEQLKLSFENSDETTAALLIQEEIDYLRANIPQR